MTPSIIQVIDPEQVVLVG